MPGILEETASGIHEDVAVEDHAASSYLAVQTRDAAVGPSQRLMRDNLYQHEREPKSLQIFDIGSRSIQGTVNVS